MGYWIIVLITLISLPLSLKEGFGQEAAPGQGRVIVPPTSVEQPGDIGKRAHTNHLIFVRPGATGTAPHGETPASLACVYATASPLVTGCPINGTTALPTGGSGTIAIVDAYDYPTAEDDLNAFSSQFGLPPCTSASGCFQVVYASGTKPEPNCGWAQESAIDIEWAHAMAPGAKIVLVEAASSSFSDLLQGVAVASSLVAGSKGRDSGEVSMSWGGSEFRGETTLDSLFATRNVVYFGASGDSPGKPIYPAASPNVVAAGGTTVNRDSNGMFTSESAWKSGGGGPSKYEPLPSYQAAIASIIGSTRGTPDFSFDADPSTGVSVYDTTPCQGLSGWLVFGGTSVSSPSLAGIVNLAGSFLGSTDLELSTIYSHLGNASDFRDITTGKAGKFRALTGWDFATGVGSDQGTAGK